ncbi:hypothetical protein P691DRAFT_777169 [Macrolepiota fuliginosa MF-IS2]|uniref:F-box domain-containing protein n=1 Tax=Macrolepiota fuliginosa MF-IS2 TaxID=1400762 RepID=A0A9P6BZZ7_9AGAR|nr:hypothetical protein P691DRAFT_777169 [Macrolepiota fuliginosa MF-IS2]
MDISDDFLAGGPSLEPVVVKSTIIDHSSGGATPPASFRADKNQTKDMKLAADGGPMLKKRRLDSVEMGGKEVGDEAQAVTKSSALIDLPFDILEEILLHTGYPGDILAVARTCKALCTKLVDPAASLVWKKMRIRIGLPDPVAYEQSYEGGGSSRKLNGVQSFVNREPAYAAFIFGGGTCQVCGETTERIPRSFALRLYLCGNLECTAQMRESFTRQHSGSGSELVWSMVPVVESLYSLDSSQGIWPHIGSMTLPGILQVAKRDTTDLVPISKEQKIARNTLWMRFCSDLSKWHREWQANILNLRDKNDSKGQAFALGEGWSYSDMLTSTLYSGFYDGKFKRRESITDEELEKMRPAIAQDLYRLQEKKNAKIVTRLQETNLNSLWKLYQKLMSSPEHYPYLPPFTVFLQLPTVKLLRSSDLAAAKIDVKTATRGNAFTKEMLTQDIDKWVAEAKRALLEILGGSSEWNVMVPANRMPHPVLRLDARWKCKPCNSVEHKYEMDECLDFAGACRHQCPEKDGKKKRKGSATRAWSADNFVKDEQACSVMATCLEHLNIAGEGLEGIRSQFEKGFWRCMSCNPPLYLRPQCIVGHSHRHPIPMKVEIVRPGIVMKPRPGPPGLAQWLMDGSKGAKESAGMPNYKCLHCVNPIKQRDEKLAQEKEDQEGNGPDAAAAPQDSTPQDPDTGTTKTEHKVQSSIGQGNPADDKTKKIFENKFNFNGLRSHLSSKHKIYRIRDEDFSCYQFVQKFPCDFTENFLSFVFNEAM